MLLGMEFTGLRRALRLSFRHLTPVLHKSPTPCDFRRANEGRPTATQFVSFNVCLVKSHVTSRELKYRRYNQQKTVKRSNDEHTHSWPARTARAQTNVHLERSNHEPVPVYALADRVHAM